MTPKPQRRATDTVPRSLWVILVALIFLGSLSVALTLTTSRDANLARQTDLKATQTLVEEVVVLEQLIADSMEDHRTRNEEIHACLVELVFAIVQRGDTPVSEIENPCPEPINSSDVSIETPAEAKGKEGGS